MARESGQLDCFITGNDGRVYTSWWHEGSDWSGINDNWRAIGGFFPAAAPVAALARMSDQLDCFITGNDGRVYTSWWHEGSDWSGINNNWRADRRLLPRRDLRNRRQVDGGRGRSQARMAASAADGGPPRACATCSSYAFRAVPGGGGEAAGDCAQSSR